MKRIAVYLSPAEIEHLLALIKDNRESTRWHYGPEEQFVKRSNAMEARLKRAIGQ